MSAQLSKEVTDRLRACLFVLAAFVTEGATVAADMLGIAQPHLKAEDPEPGFHSVFIALGRTLKAAIDKLVDARVCQHLGRFRGRLAGLDDATDVRYRMAWVGGQLLVRHDVETALKRLDSVRLHLFKKGPLRHAIAVSLDEAQIYCRRDHELGLQAAKTVLATCLRHLPEGSQGQDGDLRNGVEAIAELLPRQPENAVDALADLRSSFVVSVPGIVAERLTLRW